MTLSKFSLGIGDRFGREGVAQLAALKAACNAGVEITPVWNKSYREHSLVGSRPADTRCAAAAAVAAAGWAGRYFVDADHIGLKTAGEFLEGCDFFTLDVADALSQRAGDDETEAFLRRHPEVPLPHGRGSEGLSRESTGLTGEAGGTKGSTRFRAATVREREVIAGLLPAAREAGRIYRFIREHKDGDFVTEVSMDETATPHSPFDLLVFLAALADENIPVNTVAPRFGGEFHKGVDYEGDVEQFEREFAGHVQVIARAIGDYGLPENLKLSVHSGSDKFSIYGPIRRVLNATGAGVHLKTAGTTWLEELIGLAEADGSGLALAKEIYAQAYARRAELQAPYAAVVKIREDRLPCPDDVRRWSAEQFAGALRHDPTNPAFNTDFRQLLHIAFRIAAEMGQRYLSLVERHADSIGRNVTHNLLERHIRPLFL
jgi:hypothetical protein